MNKISSETLEANFKPIPKDFNQILKEVSG